MFLVMRVLAWSNVDGSRIRNQMKMCYVLEAKLVALENENDVAAKEAV